MGLHSEALLDHKMILVIKKMNQYLNHFPRHERYGLSQQIRNTAYDVYGLIVEAQKRYHKKTTLSNLDIRHEQLRMFIRLGYEMGYFEYSDGVNVGGSATSLAERRFHSLSIMVDEIGRMINGWMKAAES